MNNHRQTDQTARAVPCLVALLFSLAAIAQWAASAPAPLRYPVLAILRRAEAVAHSCIYWQLHDHGLTLQWALPGECRQYSDPQAARHLAWWFRILAVALRDLPRRVFFHQLRRQTAPVPRSSRGDEGRARPLARPETYESISTAGASANQRQRVSPPP